MRTFALVVVLLAVLASTAQANKKTCLEQHECSSDQYCFGGYCVSCKSNADCALNEYCNIKNMRDLDRFGSCQKFPYNHAKCIPLESGDLADPRVDNSTKCAVQYYDPSNPNVNQRMVTEYQGYCIEGRCRLCDYTGNNGKNDAESGNEGKGKPRTCVFPGKYATPHSAEWSPGRYYENPVYVWLAIFFCFIFIITVFNMLGYLFHK
ncbi:hypothetical protein PPL_02846 [Heterostelium album PN500]|uniref:Uncharacterized protein n=1 Tax=Heterostelium pallidum (strain ATCC 26659 / Pp 5 / PN500) TaxID=670386 RepID=D3B380_HETP5|nr:hypothetical protein PPL_02846 [Heterostelium album PN500]EFA83778.1 hypothetical protein PPL_02846 [Heterostelium album PN500]|eukprot:XP_020435895.1 hypothetical protein PPL_02846 [Heterostelium album PN500]